MIGIIDCNNFFVSCERVFQPQLVGKAVVVLSNNDGCVVARSNEAKQMGIKMGVPYFQVQQLVKNGLLHARSSNYRLYGDMSRRVMSLVRQHVPHLEIYSIDEGFFDLEGISNPEVFGRELAALIRKCTGIPVSVGIAPTKTLAKIASKFAKKYAGYHHCCLIDNEEKRLAALRLTEIGDVWGIGRQHKQRLTERGIHTAYDFTLMRETTVRSQMALPGVHTWRELRGQSVFDFQPTSAKRSMTSSRSFKDCICDYEELRSIIADFAANCAERLRRENSAALVVTTFIATNRFRTDLMQYSNAASVKLDVATSDVRELVSAALQAFEQIYLPYYDYKKAGVSLNQIVSNQHIQQNIFDTVDRNKQQRLLKAIDAIKAKEGKEAIRVAVQGNVQKAMRSEHISKNYTTSLADIIEVK